MYKFALIILALMPAVSGCTRDDDEVLSFATGTYQGTKSLYYPATDLQSTDTITIHFDGSSYSYTGSTSLDFGRGSYLLKNGAIEFNDSLARIALYSWEWILSGTYQLKTENDSLILDQHGASVQITCKLKKAG